MAVDGIATEGPGPDLTPQWSIRPCGASDVDALALVGAATFLESYAGWLPGQDILRHCGIQHSAESYATLLADPRTSAWLAEVKDAPIGYLVLATPDVPEELMTVRDIELKRIYLFSRFHATGLAGALLHQGLERARHSGADRMLVGLHRENLRAARFYRKHGFVEIGRRMFQMGSRVYDDPVLAKQL